MNRKTAMARQVQDAYLLFLVFAGVGLGTVLVAQPGRQAVLLVALAVVSLVYRNNHPMDLDFSLASAGRGAMLGLVVSVPLLAFLPHTLERFSESLYGTDNTALIFYQACLVAGPVEEYFFRGIVSECRGSSASTGLYALTGLIYSLPGAPLMGAVIAALAMGILGIVYAHVHENHGLAAAIACHLTATFVLQVCPSLLASLRLMFS